MQSVTNTKLIKQFILNTKLGLNNFIFIKNNIFIGKKSFYLFSGQKKI